MYPINLLQEEINRIIPSTNVGLTPEYDQIILQNNDFNDALTINIKTMEIKSSTAEPTYFHTIIKENLTEIIEIFHNLTINIFPYLARRFDFICNETLEKNMFQLKYNGTSCMVKLFPDHPFMKVSAIHSTDYNNLKDFDHQLNMLHISFERNRRWQLSTFEEEKKIREKRKAISQKQFLNNHSILDRIETDTIKDNVKDTIKSIMNFNTKIQSHFNNQSHINPCDMYHFLLSSDELTVDTIQLMNSKLPTDKKQLSDSISNILNSHISLSLLSEKTRKEIIHIIEEYSNSHQNSNIKNIISTMLDCKSSIYTDEQIKTLLSSKHITPYEKKLISTLHNCGLTFPTLLLKINNRIIN